MDPWYAATEQVTEGVHRVPVDLGLDALRATNAYVLQGADGRLTVIDPGMALVSSQHDLQAGLARVGVALSAETDFLVTHFHRDHYTLARS